MLLSSRLLTDFVVCAGDYRTHVLEQMFRRVVRCPVVKKDDALSSVDVTSFFSVGVRLVMFQD